eukprot:gnl/MRDRNA2_/MRDRNA2_48305_c0_seq1.p1 gnl/MRDRNA2_/MRDRNA2_48305_c0~~gnl/MRDRNA2_/MRDRNA2_48305_c0_seq1.p1  ORF type:complete len:153 (-),score=34.64 gnl/MRDRNA2_/MRDRNA2_48305_c0_seq1:157-615(-)
MGACCCGETRPQGGPEYDNPPPPFDETARRSSQRLGAQPHQSQKRTSRASLLRPTPSDQLLEEEEKAASKIQAVYRGKAARDEVGVMMTEREEQQRSQEEREKSEVATTGASEARKSALELSTDEVMQKELEAIKAERDSRKSLRAENATTS